MPSDGQFECDQGSLKKKQPGTGRIEEMLKTEKLLISLLAYIKQKKSFQSFLYSGRIPEPDPHEVKTIITRAGKEANLYSLETSIKLITFTWTCILMV